MSKFATAGLRDQSFIHEFPQVDAKVSVNFHHVHSNVIRMEARVSYWTEFKYAMSKKLNC